MKLIALFVICLVVKINTGSKRLLLNGVPSKCPPVNLCSGDPCLECNPKNGHCIYICCLDDTDCKAQEICLNGFCAANDCPDPCVDPDNNFEPVCPVGITCISQATTGCPEFVKCLDTTEQPRPCPECGDDWFCCDPGCVLCAEDVEICRPFCQPYGP
eukprot:UN08146